MTVAAPSGIRIDQAKYDALPDDEKAEVDKALAEIAAAVEANPLLAFKPHPKQAKFLAAKQRRKMVSGGNRSGKTECSIANDIIQCVDEQALPDHLKPFKHLTPPVKGRIVTPKFAHHEEVSFPKLRSLVPKDQLLGGSWEKAFSKQRRVLNFANGSTIQFLTFDQDVDAHASADLDFVHFDEEPEGEHGWQVYRENLARLIDRNGYFYISMTPLFGMSWTYDEYLLPWEDGHDPETDIFTSDEKFVIRVDMDDNPHVSEKAKVAFLAGLSREEARARKEGRVVHFGGMIYPEFDSDEHVCDEPKLDHLAQLTHIVGIDPGINTTGVVFIGFDRDNAAWLYDELYLHENDAIPENAVSTINAVLERHGVKKPTFLIDPSARNRASVNADNVQSAYARAGLMAMPAQNAVEAGIFEVKRRLQHEPPMFRVSRRCEKWLWERKRYRQKPMENQAFEVVKRDDHLMDATRYVCMARPVKPHTHNPAKPKRYAYNPTYQPPYSEEPRFQESPPMGPLS